MKEIMAQVLRPKTIAMDYMAGNTRIIISRDYIKPPEEQKKIWERVGQISYDVQVRNAMEEAERKKNEGHVKEESA